MAAEDADVQHEPTPAMHPIANACRIGGIGRTKLFELIRDGRVDARKLGRRTLITDTSLREFLDGLPRAMKAG
jgi:hypothetical protein